MATTIDELVVSLGLDLEKWKAGNKIAAEQMKKMEAQASHTAKEMSASGDKAAEFFTKSKIAALSLIGVLLGGKGIEAFVRDQTKSLSDLGRQARNIGEAAPAVEAFAMAIQRMGGSAESARGMLQNFAQQRAEFVNFGKGNFGPEMALIGGNLNTKPLEAIQLFQAYIQRMKDSADGIQKINLIGKDVFGFDQATTNALIQMATVAKLNQEIGKSYQLGTPTPEMIERATKFQESLAGLEQAATADGRALLDDAYPGLTKFTDALTAMIQQNPAALVGLSAIAGVLTVISAFSLTRVTAEVLGLTKAATMLSGIAGFLGRLGLLGTALTTTYEGFHIGGLNEGEDAELARLRAAHGMAPDGSGGSATPNGSAGDSSLPRGIRNNNPINLQFAGQPGATKEPGPNGRFAVFPTMEQGIAAAGNQFKIDAARGNDTVRGLITKYAPSNENDTAAYIAYMSRYLGVGPDQHLNFNDPSVALAFTRGMASRENGSRYAGVVPGSPGQTPPKISLHAPIAPPPPRLPAPTAPGAGTPSQTGHNMTVGSVSIHTQATDARGIARDFTGAMVAQANRGLA